MNRKAVTGASDQNGLFASAVYDENEKNIIVKIVNTSDKTQSLKLTFNGLKRNERLTSGKLITLSSSDIEAENTLDNPALIIPVENDLSINGNVLDTNIRAYTFKIYKIKKL
jgi:alpha-L-arabinofuranosidase